MCGSFSTKYTPKLFMKPPPEGLPVCRSCVEAKKNREFLAERGYSFDQLKGLEYRQQQQIHAELLGKPLGVPVRKQGVNPPF
jgi:hypothetical protein